MANGTYNPLTADDLDKLNQVLKMIPDTDTLIAKMQASNIPVDQAAVENAQQKEMAAALKRNFFPQAP